MTENALALIDGKTELVFTTQNGLDPLINAVKSQVDGVIHDISTDKGRKACISLSVMVRDTKTELERRKMALTEDMRSKISLINTEGKRAWTELEKIQKEVRQPVTDWEEVEKKRVTDFESDIIILKQYGNYALLNWQTIEQAYLDKTISAFNGEYNKDFQEFSVRAEAARIQSLADINEAISKRNKHDAEQAELARFRQEETDRKKREHEEKIKAEAAEKARKEAEEKAEREQRKRDDDARIAQEKANREKRDIEEKARIAAESAERERLKLEQEKETERKRAEKAEADRIESEQRAEKAAKDAADKAEREKKEITDKAKRDAEAAIQADREKRAKEEKRKADEIAKREADEAHKDTINATIVTSLMNLGLSGGMAETIVVRMSQGHIPHVKINY